MQTTLHPIATAPRDGTIVQVSSEDGGAWVMRWNGERNLWECPERSFTWSEVDDAGPTHWREIERH